MAAAANSANDLLRPHQIDALSQRATHSSPENDKLAPLTGMTVTKVTEMAAVAHGGDAVSAAARAEGCRAVANENPVPMEQRRLTLGHELPVSR
jgi:hypothetical protein